MSMYNKNHYNIVLIKINGKKNKHSEQLEKKKEQSKKSHIYLVEAYGPARSRKSNTRKAQKVLQDGFGWDRKNTFI